jgi:DNA ligase D-like protein (predicted 3'-phosphoesterase)
MALFVVHKHDAHSLHYDFRIQVGRVLVSWAVPKGISPQKKVKHLAIPTPDHPYSYRRFEGVIPKGEYGAGPVMVWDIGTYKNIKKSGGTLVPMKKCLKDGTVEMWLEGKKLKGGYALIRTKLGSAQKRSWLMIKMDDEYANKAIKDKTKSALTGRTMKQIEQDAA